MRNWKTELVTVKSIEALEDVLNEHERKAHYVKEITPLAQFNKFENDITLLIVYTEE